jgi:hypothetical protein
LVPIGNATPDKRITAIPARARIWQHPAGHRGQPKRIVECAMGEQTEIGEMTTDPRN